MQYALVYGNGVWPTGSLTFSACVSAVTFLFSHQPVAFGAVLSFAFSFALREYLAGGLIELESSCFPVGDVLLLSLSCRVQSRGANDIGRWDLVQGR